MKDKKKLGIIISFIVAFLLMLLLILWSIKQYIDLSNRTAIAPVNDFTPEEKVTAVDILEKNNAVVDEEYEDKIYVKFDKDLFDENGKSNEEYFTRIIDDINSLRPESDYYLIDKEKEIEIHVILNQNNTYKYTINNNENYFDKVDGDVYAEVSRSKISESSHFYYNNDFLYLGAMSSYYIKEMEDELGEGRDIGNGYKSYKDGGMFIRTSPVGAIRNIVYTGLYDDEITEGVKVGTPLKKIKEMFPQNAFGSISEGYLGYITNDLYSFFYPDEVSVYTYKYDENDRFESILKDYLETGDLKDFATRISATYSVYDSFEYDEDLESASILISNRGIKIEIRDNDPKGITLYNNYCFTEKTRNYVKEGKISYKNEDLVDLCERQRRIASR